MHRTTRAPYFFAGLLLTNSTPHFVAGVTGRRMPTPFGLRSSAPLNLVWAALNVAGASALLLRANRSPRAQTDGKAWLIALAAGCLFWSAWMFGFESLAAWRRGRQGDRKASVVPFALIT